MTQAPGIVGQNALLAAFFVREGQYAIDAASIQEVIRFGALTPVRHAPAEVAGIMNLRGKIVTVLDLGLQLGLGRIESAASARVLIVENHGEFIGLLVDRAEEVVPVEAGHWEPLPVNIPPAQARYFLGVCRPVGRVLTVLDTARILMEDVR
jgi:purine-binding chemotaxis protein CheW